MKAGLCILGIACLIGVASAQDNTQPQNSSNTTQTQTETKTQTQTQAQSSSTATGKMAEMKTQTYKGTLVDASCAGGSAAPATATANAGTASGDANSANRTAGDCAVSASSNALALKTKDGRTLRFDMVGNQRAQDAMKTNKRWSKGLAANKPLQVTVSGVVNGDKLIVTSIH